jgi:hypothetical protein
VGELLRKSEDDLLAITNFGQKSLDEVIEKLDERGLALRGMRNADHHACNPDEGPSLRRLRQHQRLMMANLVSSLIAAEAS